MTFFLVIATHNVVLFFQNCKFMSHNCDIISYMKLNLEINFLRFILRCKQAAIFDQYFPLMSVYCNLLSALYFSSGTYIGQMKYEIAMN